MAIGQANIQPADPPITENEWWNEWQNLNIQKNRTASVLNWVTELTTSRASWVRVRKVRITPTIMIRITTSSISNNQIMINDQCFKKRFIYLQCKWLRLLCLLFSLLISSKHCSGLSKLVRRLINTSLFWMMSFCPKQRKEEKSAVLTNSWQAAKKMSHIIRLNAFHNNTSVWVLQCRLFLTLNR